MADVFSEQKRSEVMSNVGTKDTNIEIMVRKELWDRGYRYRVNVKDVPGNPDICHKGKKLAVFIDGCFWHGCQKCNKAPKDNSDFWNEKIKSNIERRKEVRGELRKEDWSILEFWGHEIKDGLDYVVSEIERELR